MCFIYHFFGKYYLLLFFFFDTLSMYAQSSSIIGIIKDDITEEKLDQVTLKIKGSSIFTTTNSLGEFYFDATKLPLGSQILVISKQGYITKYFPIILNDGEVLNLKNISLTYDFSKEQLGGTITLSDYELEEETFYNTTPLLQASRDLFLTAAAYDFSATFFRPRGIGNEYGKILINGIEMNTLYDHRPNWAHWGGLNDVQRNQEFSNAISENDHAFGGLLGTSNVIMRASKYRKGSRLSYAISNRSYQGRVMATYHSGLTKKGWAFSTSLSKRYGDQGFIEGTLYDANAFFIAIEKKWKQKHALNLIGLFTPNRRGRSTAITKEVAQIKGNTYNPNWGYLNGEIRNARERTTKEPLFMLNHYWNINTNSMLQTNIAFQTGTTTNSGIDNSGTDAIAGPNAQQIFVGGGRSKAINPIHPENLPSYFLQKENPTPLDYQKAFLAQQNLINDGQLNWEALIQTNQQNTLTGTNATYIIYEDSKDNTRLIGNMILNTKLNNRITLNTTINYQKTNSQYYAKVKDLLGGSGFLDIDAFASTSKEGDNSALIHMAQSDLRSPNRIVRKGDRYDYNYKIDASVISCFAQGQFNFNPIHFFLSATASQTSYQREGLFENGYFPGKASFGKSEPLSFINYGAKSGATIALNGHNFIKLHGAYFNKAPAIRHAFVNPRQNHTTVTQLMGQNQENETVISADASYIFRSPKIKMRLTGYYTKILDATRISSFYTEAIEGFNSGFVQETVTDIDKLYIGGELGIAYQITPTLKLKGVAAIGNFTFNNDPTVTLTSTSKAFIKDNGIKHLGTSALKGYRIATGPQRAAQLGIEYRDPDFWWFGITTNYFSNAFINISPFARTSNFYKDTDGLPINAYDKAIAQDLLKQEQFKGYFLVNAIGGKSWKIKNHYFGFFASVNNVLNQKYTTGGFEQARKANYKLALEESKRKTPVYGSKYFYGLGTTYYLTVYVKL